MEKIFITRGLRKTSKDVKVPFPFAKNDVTLVLLQMNDSGVTVTQAKDVSVKRFMLRSALNNSFATVLAFWPGDVSSDCFVVDDIQAALDSLT